MTYTGGELNLLNGKMGISAPYKSVPVMKLIKIHAPKSKSELVDLIDFHHKNKCECGIISTGSVEDFGKNLYESQLKFWGKYKYSLEECIKWEYDLFVVQSLKGGNIEKKAIKDLTNLLKGFEIEEAVGYLDEDLRIDIVIKKNNLEVAGVQVKPKTFNLMREEVIHFQNNANKKWGKPVFILYYDNESNYTNLEGVLEKISKLT
ncbi:MAG: hypothetical protein RLZ10_17 [Bacteroidota bacterium]|jgi:hypothetical protein